jgi:hypothetical protein
VAGIVEDLSAGREDVPEPMATKRCSLRLMLRIPAELHWDLALRPAESSVSLNRLARHSTGSPASPWVKLTKVPPDELTPPHEKRALQPANHSKQGNPLGKSGKRFHTRRVVVRRLPPPTESVCSPKET